MRNILLVIKLKVQSTMEILLSEAFNTYGFYIVFFFYVGITYTYTYGGHVFG